MPIPAVRTLASFPPDRAARLWAALRLLQDALADAEEAGRERWEFALTVQELLAAGAVGTDLRWLVAHGLAAHAVEKLLHRSGARRFHPAPDLSLSDHSCFVLTDQGRAFATELPVGPRPAARTSGADPPPEVRPRWDAAVRELTWHGLLVKRFQTPAECQEIILAVFEEEGWPVRIDDPLKRRHDRDGRHRLHDVVRALNRNQQEVRIRFRRDGRGQGVCWAGVAPPLPPRVPALPLSQADRG